MTILETSETLHIACTRTVIPQTDSGVKMLPFLEFPPIFELQAILRQRCNTSLNDPQMTPHHNVKGEPYVYY